jgi:PAS domain S-box-containing protein
MSPTSPLDHIPPVTGTGTPDPSQIENAELFRQIVENIDQVSWMTDVHTKKLLYVGPAFEELWGRGSRSRYLDREWAVENVHPEDRERFVSFLEKEVLEPVEDLYRIVRPDGSVRSLHCRHFPVRDPEGRVYGAVGMARDITDQREAEERLRQAHKMAALERMAGGLLHHFNNLLTVILGYSELLLNKTETEDRGREDLRQISDASNQAARITEQLLAFSGHQFTQPKLVNINHLATDMVARLSGVLGADITVETAFRPDMGCINVDPDQLNRAVMELAANARDAMSNGGRFRIETEMVEVSGAQTDKWVGRPGRCVQLRISDTGCGMGQQIQERAFEPFFTTKSLGERIGLGLSMVYGIVRQSQGAIHLHSEPGQGTVFRLCFPSGIEAEAETAAPSGSGSSVA